VFAVVLLGYEFASLGERCPTFPNQRSDIIFKSRIRPLKMRRLRFLEAPGTNHWVRRNRMPEHRPHLGIRKIRNAFVRSGSRRTLYEGSVLLFNQFPCNFE